MFVNFTAHNAKGSKGNSSSCSNIFEYLEKEDNSLNIETSLNDIKENETLGFFNQDDINIPKEKVIKDIDNNRGKRGINESNFYMINISPSYKEQKHLSDRVENYLIEKNKNDKLKLSDKQLDKAKDIMMRDLLMNYSRDVMKDYASNFDRKINGKEITDKDLLYYGKVETRRGYNFKDRDVINNNKIFKELETCTDKNQKKILEDKLKKDYFTNEIIKEGNVKGGLNYHVHIVVSRHDNTNDKNNKISLSPMSKYRVQQSKMNNQENKTIGFNRDNFFQKAENNFDKSFNYNRDYINSYEANKRNANTKGTRENIKKEKKNILDLSTDFGKNKLQNTIKNELKNYSGLKINTPKQNIKMQMSQHLGFNIPTKLTIPTNPASLTLKVAKTVVKTIEKGYGM